MIDPAQLAMIAAGALPSDAPAIRELVEFYRRFAGKGLGDLAARQILLEQRHVRAMALEDTGINLLDALEEAGDGGPNARTVQAIEQFRATLAGKPNPSNPSSKKDPEVGEAIARAYGGNLFRREQMGRWYDRAPRRATPAEEAALRAAHELVTDPGGRRPFDSMPCPHSFIVVDKCRACGAYMGPQP